MAALGIADGVFDVVGGQHLADDGFLDFVDFLLSVFDFLEKGLVIPVGFDLVQLAFVLPDLDLDILDPGFEVAAVLLILGELLPRFGHGPRSGGDLVFDILDEAGKAFEIKRGGVDL